MPRKIWVPYLRDAFDKEEETDSEHSKWLHSSETVHLKIFLIFFLILLSITLLKMTLLKMTVKLKFIFLLGVFPGVAVVSAYVP